MIKRELTKSDYNLIALAENSIKNHADSDRHAVCSVLRSSSGKIYSGINLDTYVGRAATCAESISIGSCVMNDDLPIETIVSVHIDAGVVSPCGVCRELIADYSPEVFIILREQETYFKVKITELFPYKYLRENV